jgi:hypothetical protein
LTINKPRCTHAFTVRTLNICRKPRHQKKTNQCHLLVLFIIIGLTRSTMLQFSYIPHVQARTKTVKRIGKGEKGDLRIGSIASARHTMDTDANAAALHQEDTLPSLKGCLSHHSTPGILRCHHRHHNSNGHRFVSTCRGYIQYIGQPVHIENIYYYEGFKDMSTQPDV